MKIVSPGVVLYKDGKLVFDDFIFDASSGDNTPANKVVIDWLIKELEMLKAEVDPKFCTEHCCCGRFYDKRGCMSASVDNVCEHPNPRKKKDK